MNLAFGARTNWGKSYSYGLQAYTERNAPEYDRTVLVDYKDKVHRAGRVGTPTAAPASTRD